MQDINLHCLGASQEVGRSAFLLETDRRLLLDYGIKIFGKDGHAEYPISIPAKLDAAIISHAHMDHIGFVPNLYNFSNVRWFATPPSKDLAEMLWKDSIKIMGAELPFSFSQVKKALKYWNPLLYGQQLSMGETQVRALDAGHISGSAMIELIYGKKKIVYTGDYKMEETMMHKGAKPVQDADVVMIDSTYALKEHPERKKVERELMDEIEETISEGGTVLMPAFSLGRTQELIALIRTYNDEIPVFVDGMGKDITDVYIRHGKYMKDVSTFRNMVQEVNMVRSPYDKKRATKDPAVIVTSAGMMEGGPVLGYLMNVNSDSKVIMTGYNVQGTNGWKLRNEGYVTINGQDLEVDLPVQYFDLSAHAGRSEVLNFIKHANPEKIVIVHSDAAPAFERELKEDFGYDAVAPKVGDVIKL